MKRKLTVEVMCTMDSESIIYWYEIDGIEYDCEMEFKTYKKALTAGNAKLKSLLNEQAN
ncbi:MAG: hypothetical protein ABIP51_23735 [Bacteroidia bacterium]